MGQINRPDLGFITELGRRVKSSTEDPLETANLFRGLSICRPYTAAKCNSIQGRIYAQHRGRDPQASVATVIQWNCFRGLMDNTYFGQKIETINLRVYIRDTATG